MPNGQRYDAPGVPHHVFARGLDGQALFPTPAAIDEFVSVLAQAQRLFGFELLAFAVMLNHFHIALRTGATHLSTIFHHIDTILGIRFNKRNRRRGYVLECRFHDTIVDTEAYFLELIRYVLLNPVRAGAITLAELEHHRSTSFPVLAGTVAQPFVAAEEVLSHFGAPDVALRNLRDFLALGVGISTSFDEMLETAIAMPRSSGPFVLGTETFAKEMRSRLAGATPSVVTPEPIPDVDRLVLAVTAATSVDVRGFLEGSRESSAAEARALVSYLAVRELGLSMAAIAVRLKISAAAVSKAVARGALLAAGRPELVEITRRARA